MPSAARITTRKSPARRRSNPQTLLVLHFDADKLRADQLHLGEIAAVTATISGLALGGRTVVEDATTTSDLMSSTDSAYLIWKLRQAQKGRIRVGPIERRSGGTSDVKVLPLRMTAAEVAALDEAWRRLGFKSRTALLKKAINALLGPSDDQRPTPSTVEALAIAG